MAVRAVLYVRVLGSLSNDTLTRLRERMPRELGLDVDADFRAGGPLLAEPNDWAMPVRDGVSRWYEANLWRAFYWPGESERGHPPTLVRCGEWLEANVPGSEVWYGHDIDDENLRPFGPQTRDALLAAYQKDTGPDV